MCNCTTDSTPTKLDVHKPKNNYVRITLKQAKMVIQFEQNLPNHIHNQVKWFLFEINLLLLEMG